MTENIVDVLCVDLVDSQLVFYLFLHALLFLHLLLEHPFLHPQEHECILLRYFQDVWALVQGYILATLLNLALRWAQ